MNYLKLIGEIKEINIKKGQIKRKGNANDYIVKVKIVNTIHPSLSLPKGITRHMFTINRKWIFPFVPKLGSMIGVSGDEIDMELDKINLSNKIISITILPELGGRIASLQYKNNSPIQSPLLYVRKANLGSAGISEDLGEKLKLSTWKFIVKRKKKNSLTLESEKKGWIVRKSIFLDNNIIYKRFELEKKGVKKEVDITYREMLSLVPDIKNLSIHIQTEEKLFTFNASPLTHPWNLPSNYYSVKNGYLAKVSDTVLLWTKNMIDIDGLEIKEKHWLINIASIWSKIKVKKGNSKLFKSKIILGENFRIYKNKIGIKSGGKWLWIRDGKIVS